MNKIKESVGNGLKAAQVGAGKVAEVVSAKTAEARLNMAVNGKLRRPFKSMNTHVARQLTAWQSYTSKSC